MGKATIISETGAGLYTIKPIYETTLLDSEITRLENEITQYTSQLSTVDTQLSTIQTEYAGKQSQLSSAINTYRAELQINPATANIEPVNALVLELNEVYIRLTAKQREKAIYTLKKVSGEKRKTKLEAVKAETVNQSAWCVTYTAGLTGEVDTIEINGEPDQILIDTTNSMSDSKLCPILGQTVAGSLFNFSLTPFWQKWKPTFRNGTITSITGDTANVSLDAANSHYQALGINQSSTLSNVPIVYLSCNGAAFTTGDDVVVAFIGQDWSAPRIIGFQDNPEECPGSASDVNLYGLIGCYDINLDLDLNWGLSSGISGLAFESNPDPGNYAKLINFDEGSLSVSIDFNNPGDVLYGATGLPLPNQSVNAQYSFSFAAGVYTISAQCGGLALSGDDLTYYDYYVYPSYRGWLISVYNLDGAGNIGVTGGSTELFNNGYTVVYRCGENASIGVTGYEYGTIKIQFKFEGALSSDSWDIWLSYNEIELDLSSYLP
jgi:hypothetical protein